MEGLIKYLSRLFSRKNDKPTCIRVKCKTELETPETDLLCVDHRKEVYGFSYADFSKMNKNKV